MSKLSLNNGNNVRMQNEMHLQKAKYQRVTTEISTGNKEDLLLVDLVTSSKLQHSILLNDIMTRDLIRVQAQLNIAADGISEMQEVTNNALKIAQEHSKGDDEAKIVTNKLLQQQLHQLERIVGTTQFNGQTLLNGSCGNAVALQRKYSTAPVRLVKCIETTSDAGFVGNDADPKGEDAVIRIRVNPGVNNTDYIIIDGVKFKFVDHVPHNEYEVRIGSTQQETVTNLALTIAHAPDEVLKKYSVEAWDHQQVNLNLIAIKRKDDIKLPFVSANLRPRAAGGETNPIISTEGITKIPGFIGKIDSEFKVLEVASDDVATTALCNRYGIDNNRLGNPANNGDRAFAVACKIDGKTFIGGAAVSGDGGGRQNLNGASIKFTSADGQYFAINHGPAFDGLTQGGGNTANQANAIASSYNALFEKSWFAQNINLEFDSASPGYCQRSTVAFTTDNFENATVHDVKVTGEGDDLTKIAMIINNHTYSFTGYNIWFAGAKGKTMEFTIDDPSNISKIYFTWGKNIKNISNEQVKKAIEVEIQERLGGKAIQLSKEEAIRNPNLSITQLMRDEEGNYMSNGINILSTGNQKKTVEVLKVMQEKLDIALLQVQQHAKLVESKLDQVTASTALKTAAREEIIRVDFVEGVATKQQVQVAMQAIITCIINSNTAHNMLMQTLKFSNSESFYLDSKI